MMYDDAPAERRANDDDDAMCQCMMNFVNDLISMYLCRNQRLCYLFVNDVAMIVNIAICNINQYSIRLLYRLLMIVCAIAPHTHDSHAVDAQRQYDDNDDDARRRCNVLISAAQRTTT